MISSSYLKNISIAVITIVLTFPIVLKGRVPNNTTTYSIQITFTDTIKSLHIIIIYKANFTMEMKSENNRRSCFVTFIVFFLSNIRLIGEL